MANETTKRLDFDEIKSLALKEAARAAQIAHKYAEQLELRASNVDTLISELSTQLEDAQNQAQAFRNTAQAARQEAEAAYSETLKTVLQSFGLELPVNAKLHYEDGVPVAAEILPNPES